MNAMLKELGFEPDDRVVVVHADDVGMCQATIPAWLDLAQDGLLSSASVMPVSPWFSHVAKLCRQRPDLDVGVHLAITSEWETYRWGSLACRDPATGLVDDFGCFWPTVELCWEHARNDAVRDEIAVQLHRALDFGIDLTHVDTHMHAMYFQGFLRSYVETALSAGLPPVLTFKDGDLYPRLLPEHRPGVRDLVPAWTARGVPIFDHLTILNLSDTDRALDTAKAAFDAIRPGLTYLICHPAHDTPELRAMTDRWAHRVNEYHTFMNPLLRRHVIESGIHIIGCRGLRDSMRRVLADAQ
jgi:predicted glycoside hydrolase/deacetylase ChbG (UPF0249 family)